MRRTLIALALLPMTGGCLGTAVDVATAPIRATGRAVGLTDDHRDSDRERGRHIRRDGSMVEYCDRHPGECRYFGG